MTLPRARRPITFPELVAVLAALMAINALGVDTMLPALPAIARSLQLTAHNQQQWIIAAYMLSSGAAQIFYGPIADRFGRRRPVLICLFLYAAMSFAASLATTLPAMIAARTLQGAAAAGTRVICVAMVRDRYEGRAMARVMSLTFTIFLAVPILAPSLGALVLVFAPWPVIFHLLAAIALMIALWVIMRVPETLHPEYRRPIEPFKIYDALRIVITDRMSFGYTVALTMAFGSLMAFVNSAPQVYTGPLQGSATHFPLFFAAVAGGMAISSILNSKIVMRFGTRGVSHAALLLFIGVTGVHLVVRLLVGESLMAFTLFQVAMLFCMGLMGANFGTMAMERMASIAGTAAAVQGSLSTLLGAVVGLIIGQSFNGTALPLLVGYFLCSIGILAGALLAEGGCLFRPGAAAR